ncbi:MAG: DUF3078 domain-containing protein [Bacteroidota bacterium]|nr:DUF3078 domain-containing protein [Bacteroidota bacterium]
MNRLYLTVICFFLFAPSSLSQYIDPLYFKSPEKVWVTEGNLNFNISQVRLNNWVGGGQNSISLGSLFSYNANYKKGVNSWRNSIEAAYGLIRQGDAVIFRKTDDYMTLRSTFGRKVSDNFRVTSIYEFRTQFTKGYNHTELGREDLISDFMAPGFMQISLGMSYSKKDFYEVILSPFTGKFTFVLNDSLSSVGAFGVVPGEKVRLEGGPSIRGTIQKDIFENIRLRSNLNLFSNYKKVQNIDVNWELFLIMKVNKYITSNISTHIIYDDDIRIPQEDGRELPEVQFKNVINIGFAFQF